MIHVRDMVRQPVAEKHPNGAITLHPGNKRRVILQARSQHTLDVWLPRLKKLYEQIYSDVMVWPPLSEGDKIPPSNQCVIIGCVQGQFIGSQIINESEHTGFYYFVTKRVFLEAHFRWHRAGRQVVVNRHVSPYLPRDVVGLVIQWIDV